MNSIMDFNASVGAFVAKLALSLGVILAVYVREISHMF